MDKKDSIKEQEEEKKPEEFAQDEQTGKIFRLEQEKVADIAAATISILYSIVMLVFFSWLLFDICTGNKLLLTFFPLESSKLLDSPLFRLIAYTVIGGGLGGVINGIRSFIVWHCERRAYGWRFLWKNISLPLLGAVLAAIVYAIIRGGIAAFEGGFVPSEANGAQAFSAFAIGALAGYGSHKVFRWLDDKVNKLFRISPTTETEVPDLIAKTKDEAEIMLKKANLILGEVDHEIIDDSEKIDKVIHQNPDPSSKIQVGGTVAITIGKKP